MNNKGFTLVELLSVMVILISISLVAVVNITSSLERRDVKECEEQQTLAIGLAKIYFSLASENVTSVTIGDLKSKNYFKEDDKTDRLNDSDKITLSDNKYLYNEKEVGESCKSN